MANQITSWSFSRYGTYKSCPAKAKYSIIEKRPITKNIYMERGAEIHKLAEDYLKGTIARLPKELSQFADEFKAVKAYSKKKPHLVTIEDTWALRKDWSPTVWNDWAGCWVRIKLDLAHVIDEAGSPVAIVTDFKTGKYRPDSQEDYIEQLDLYALGALLKWQDLIPKGLTVRPRLLYLDHGITYPSVELKTEGRVYTGADLKPLKKEWEKRVRPMLNDKTFAPKPNKWCYSCDYTSAKGGPCKY